MVPKVLVISVMGVASAAGMGVGYVLSESKEITSISEKIKEQGKRFILSTLKDAHDTQGEALTKAYTPLLKTNPSNKPLIKEFSDKTPSKEELKKGCRDNSGENHESKEKFNAFREGCTQDNIVQHIRVTNSLKKIPLTLGDAEGENKKTKYNASAEQSNQITDTDGKDISKESLRDVKILQEGCFKNATGLYLNDDDKTFKAYKEGCTKDASA